MLKLENSLSLIIQDLRELFHSAVVLLSQQEILFLLGNSFVYKQIIVILRYLKVTRKHRCYAWSLFQFLELPSKTHEILAHDQCFFNIWSLAHLFDFMYFIRDPFHIIFKDQLQRESINIR